MKTEFLNSLSRSFHKVGFAFKKHSPEILVVTGVVGTVASTVMACKATTKLSAILEEHNDTIETFNNAYEHADELPKPYTDEDRVHDIRITTVQTGVKIAKLYAPAVLVGALSVTSILVGHNILHKRNIALATAYAAVDKGFKEYRGRVIERFGEELDKELKYNLKTKEVEEKVVNEDGSETIVKKTGKFAKKSDCSMYATFFDESCVAFEKDPQLNKLFLTKQQAYANDKLRLKGHLFLNEVHDMLGLPRTKAGQIVGWLYDPKNPTGDNYIDFGIFEVYNADFLNGYECVCLLDFNVDGDIVNDI